MIKKVQKLLTLVITCMIIFLNNPHNAYAATSLDVLELYGFNPEREQLVDVDTEIQYLDEVIDSMNVQGTVNSEHNAMVNMFNQEQKKILNDINSEVLEYQNSNNEILDKIDSEIDSCDIDDLIKYDSEYKSNVEKINILLSQMNSIHLSDEYLDTDFDLINVREVLKTEKLFVPKLYDREPDSFVIGNLEDIPWVMNNERYVTSTYGYRVDPVTMKNIRFHSGTDYRALVGTEVYALFNGTVTSCGYSATIGNYINIVSGDDIKYLVCHLSKVLVEEGQEVSQGDLIALSGATGSRCTGPHLHLQLYIQGVTYDVDKLFNKEDK